MEKPDDVPFQDLENYIIREMFRYIDQNQDGSLNFDEIRLCFQQFELLEIYNSPELDEWRSRFPDGLDVNSFIRFIRDLNRSPRCNPRFIILIKFLHFITPEDNASDRERNHLILDNLFTLFDENNDKSMSREEFRAIWTPSLRIRLDDFLSLFDMFAIPRFQQVQELPLPPGWTMEIDSSSGAPYYVNIERNITRWNRPVEPLPIGWTEMLDDASGNTYYLNTATGTTQWDPPPVDTSYLDIEGFRALIKFCRADYHNILEQLRSEYYAAALLKLGSFKGIIEHLFTFLDKDRNGTLDRHEVSNLFSALPYVNYSQELFNTYDTNRDGSLSLEEFTNLCVELNAHYTRNQDTSFIHYCYRISVGKTPMVCARSLPFSEFRRDSLVESLVLPHSQLQIPNTQYTYGQLFDAMLDRRGRLHGFVGCMGIHDAARNMTNPELVEEILTANAIANCGLSQQQCQAIGSQAEHRALLKQLLDLFIQISRENTDSHGQIQELMRTGRMESYLKWIMDAIMSDMSVSAPRFGFRYPRYSNVMVIACFIKGLSKDAQQLFFNLFVLENKEAYDSGAASCPPGVTERLLMYFRDIIQQGNSEQARIQGTAVEEPQAEHVNQEMMILNWLRQYEQYSDPVKGVGSIFYFKCYIFEKILQLSPPNNNPEDWFRNVERLLNSDGIKYMFDGGYNFIKKKSQTKRKNIKKSKIQYNRSKTHNKKRYRK